MKIDYPFPLSKQKRAAKEKPVEEAHDVTRSA